MFIEIEREDLYINGVFFCAVKSDLGSGDYKVVLLSTDGNLSPFVVGPNILFVDDEAKDGILVGDYIIDGTAINSRATLAKIVNKIQKAIDHGDTVELEVM